MGSEEENELLEEVDAVGGLKIQIWREDLQHALNGHPEVTIDKVKDTLKNPLKIIKSKTSNRVCLFYSFEIEDEASSEIMYFCAVVGVIKEGIGKLETAYETTYIKKGKVLFGRGKKNDDKI